MSFFLIISRGKLDRNQTDNTVPDDCLGLNTPPDIALQWRHNQHDGVSNHRRLDCLLNRLFGRRSKKASKLCVTDLCEGNPPVTGGSLYKDPIKQKMFPFDDIIMLWRGQVP